MPDVPLRARCAFAALTLCALLAACGDTAKLPDDAGIGPVPSLPHPSRALVPTVEIAQARGWPAGRAPAAAQGLQVGAFAQGLVHPRWLHVLPNGDVLVAETNAPPKPDDNPGIKGWVMNQAMARAGAAVPSPDRITLLRDADGDGVAEQRFVFAQGLRSPFGMARVGNALYVANTDGIVRFDYQPGMTHVAGTGTPVVDLPAGPINHHWTKNLIASPDGRYLYATVGSNSNIAENGIEQETGRAAIWQIDLQQRSKRLFATGLRNPNGMAWVPASGRLWTVVNERDELGSDLVPDYLTSVAEGAFYGWPWSYWGPHTDERVMPPRADRVAAARMPDYALGSHVAPLGLAWAGSGAFGPGFGPGMFIGEHGSWNRRPPDGYKVVFVPFDAKGEPAGSPRDVLTGFLDGKGGAYGRPVGVAVDGRGGLLVADDVGNSVWRVRPAAAGRAGAASAPPVASADAASRGPQASFGRLRASPAARRVAQWIVQTNDHRGEPFLMVDKPNARLIAFDGRGRAISAAPVLLGLARGDDSAPGIGDKPLEKIRDDERTTPAGRFVAERGRNLHGDDILWIDYDAAVSMHRVRSVNPGEHRLERLRSPSVRDNRISYGCINVPVAFFDRVIERALGSRKKVMVYVLPDSKPLDAVFALNRARRS
jgi:glucose/arabinose dehydrogenase